MPNPGVGAPGLGNPGNRDFPKLFNLISLIELILHICQLCTFLLNKIERKLCLTSGINKQILLLLF